MNAVRTGVRASLLLVVTDSGVAMAPEQLRFGASAVVSVGLTTTGMAATRYRHAPACATTLIVSLGLLPTPVDGAIIPVAISLLAASQSVVSATLSGVE